MPFISRSACPACLSANAKCLLSCSMTDARLWAYLKTYYQGRIPAEAVAEANYTLLSCCVCGCIWQQYILDESGMTQLYSIWIDPQASYHKKQQETLDIRIGYVRQCVQVAKVIKR